MNRKEEIKQIIKNAVAHFIVQPDISCFIFGSQANRKELKRADIDIGLKGNTKIELSKLNDLKQFLNYESATLYTFDVVDFNSVTKSFSSIALINIEPIN